VGFPYYSVYFKAYLEHLADDVISNNFHTIQSILKPDEYIYLSMEKP